MPSCAVRLYPAWLTLDPFVLLVGISITIVLLLLGTSQRVHVTKSGGAGSTRAACTPISTARPLDQALSPAQLLMPLLQMQLREAKEDHPAPRDRGRSKGHHRRTPRGRTSSPPVSFAVDAGQGTRPTSSVGQSVRFIT